MCFFWVIAPFFFFFFLFFSCSRWSFVDVSLIFSCPADHVPGWQPRILLDVVEAQSVIMKNTQTYTHNPTCIDWLHFRTVSYARELISLSMCYSQGDGFNTSLSRLGHYNCTVSTVTCRSVVRSCLSGVGGYVRWYGHVLPRMTLIKVVCVY